MKKLFAAAMVVILISLWACERESALEVDTSKELVKNEIDGKAHWGQTCYFFVEYGTKIGRRCYPHFPGICDIRVFCIPDFHFNPCEIVPCWIDFLDPWIIYEKINPREFGSFRDKLDLKIDPRVNAFPFTLNKGILGLQFYEKNELMQDNILYLEEDLKLDREVAKELGLQGNVVKAGKYPVAFNKENGTHNALLIIETGF